MADILEYLNWRGDILFPQLGVNNVDALIFSELSYIRYDGVITDALNVSVSLGTVAKTILGMPEPLSRCRTEKDLELLQAVANSPRFQKVGVTFYQSVFIPEEETQFAAVTFLLPDGSAFLTFRGTDSTLVGWKEDFNMSFQQSIPAQRLAKEYVQRFAATQEIPLRLGGHSKGGNLAIWAAVHCNAGVRGRILRAYSNDGPGFTAEMLASEAYQGMRDRCINYVPQSSLVGMLLEHDDNYQIIYSDKSGLMQHDPYSWAVWRNRYLYLEERSAFGEQSDAAIRKWLGSMTAEEKRELVGDLFYALESTGAKTLTELSRNKKDVVKSMVKTLADMEKPRRKRINRLLTRLFAAGVESAAPETELMEKVSRLEKLTQNGRPDLKTIRSLLERE